jgi:hypothetical protein
MVEVTRTDEFDSPFDSETQSILDDDLGGVGQNVLRTFDPETIMRTCEETAEAASTGSGGPPAAVQQDADDVEEAADIERRLATFGVYPSDYVDGDYGLVVPGTLLPERLLLFACLVYRDVVG